MVVFPFVWAALQGLSWGIGHGVGAVLAARGAREEVVQPQPCRRLRRHIETRETATSQSHALSVRLFTPTHLTKLPQGARTEV